jgi:hypothetical protein
MSFLAPLFLLGAFAIAVPFWLHRLQIQSSNRKPFSSAMLLETTEQQVHVQKKLKYLALLALRAALLALIALAFAKPLWMSPETLPGPGPDGTHLVLVDTSASMGRDGAFEQAIAIARQAIDAAPGGAMLQVFSANTVVREESALSAERGAHLAALQGLAPGAARLDFGQAMTAIDRLAETVPPPVTLHVVSDFQDSGLPARFADMVSSRIATLQVHAPPTRPAVNWSVEAVRETAGGIDVVVSGTGSDDLTTTVALSLNGTAVSTREVSGSGTTTLSFTGLVLEPGDNQVHVESRADDDLGIDDHRYHVIRNTPPAPIPLLTLGRDGLPVTYLSAALHSDPDNAFRIETAVIGEFDTRTLSRHSWLIVDDVGAVGQELEASLLEFVQIGGGLLAFAGQRSSTATRIPVSGHSIRPVGSGPVDDQFLAIGQVDSGHPLLSGTDGWYAVNLSQTIPVETLPDDQVLVRLENDEAFVIERRIGQGRMLLITGGLENQWNDFPIRPVFVSFMIEAARYLSGTEQVATAYNAGATLPLSLVGGVSGQVIDPDGQTVLSLAETTRAQGIELHKTGFYEVYTSQGDYVVAVNTDPRESLLKAIAPEMMQRWVAAMSGTAEPGDTPAFVQESDPFELWHVMLLILALVLIGESILANAHLTLRTSGGSNG